MEQELLEKVFEVVTNMQKEMMVLSTKVGNLETKVGNLETKVGGIETKINNLEFIVDTLKDLPKKVEENTKQLIEINSNIHYLWEDIKILDERLQKIEYSEIR